MKNYYFTKIGGKCGGPVIVLFVTFSKNCITFKYLVFPEKIERLATINLNVFSMLRLYSFKKLRDILSIETKQNLIFSASNHVKLLLEIGC